MYNPRFLAAVDYPSVDFSSMDRFHMRFFAR